MFCTIAAAPTLNLRTLYTGNMSLGSFFRLECEVEPINSAIQQDIFWMKRAYSTEYNNCSTIIGATYTSNDHKITLTFNSLIRFDAADYTCTATATLSDNSVLMNSSTVVVDLGEGKH